MTNSQISNTEINTPPHEPMSEADVKKIISVTFKLMSEVGLKFHPEPRAMKLLSDAGCDIADGIVKFPEDLVRKSIDSVGKSVKLWNRPGTESVELSARRMVFAAGVTAPDVSDIDTGEKRPATANDIAMIARVADALCDIDAVCLPCKITENPTIFGQIEEFAALVENTSKPLNYLCEDDAPLEAAIEIAAAIRGGEDRLRAKPYFLFFATPLPLHFAEQHINHIFLCVENGIPVTSLTVTIGGASSPVTVGGSVTHSLATDFACLTLTQLIEEGSFCGCGSVLAFIDAMTGEMGGMPEMDMAELARNQALRFMGLPPVGSFAGASIDVRFSQYALSLATASLLRAFYTQPGHSWHLGLIDSGMTFSLHSLLYCNELAGWLRRMWRGVGVDDDSLAFDITRSLGPGGDYMSEMHTAKRCRTDLWQPKYLRPPQTGSDADLMEVIDADLREILKTHHPEPLSDSTKDEIAAILKKYGAA